MIVRFDSISNLIIKKVHEIFRKRLERQHQSGIYYMFKYVVNFSLYKHYFIGFEDYRGQTNTALSSACVCVQTNVKKNVFRSSFKWDVCATGKNRLKSWTIDSKLNKIPNINAQHVEDLFCGNVRWFKKFTGLKRNVKHNTYILNWKQENCLWIDSIWTVDASSMVASNAACSMFDDNDVLILW